MAKAPQFQFSVAALLSVTTIVAMALGAAVLLDAVPAFLFGFFGVVGVWAVIRGPAALRNIAEFKRRKRELALKRDELEEDVRRRKAVVQVANDSRRAQNERP
jgi:hypothetical protein